MRNLLIALLAVLLIASPALAALTWTYGPPPAGDGEDRVNYNSARAGILLLECYAWEPDDSDYFYDVRVPSLIPGFPQAVLVRGQSVPYASLSACKTAAATWASKQGSAIVTAVGAVK